MVTAMVTAMATEDIMEKSNYSQKMQEDNRIDLAMLIDGVWKAFLRFWWIILAVLSVSASVMYYCAGRTYTPQYTAYATFTVRSAGNYGYNETRYNTMATTQLGSVFPYLLTNNVLRQLVSEDLGTNGIPGTISASALDDTNLITLTVVAEDGQLAYDILHSVIRNYPKISAYVIGDVTLNLLDESGVPEKPANAFRPEVAATYGMAAGAVGCLAVLIFYTMTRTTVTNEDDLRKLFSITCLGAIPMVRIKKRSRNKARDTRILMDTRNVPHYFVEAMRTIRTHIEKECEGNDIKTILVTSAIPGEGKTTVAINIAIALANKEKKVVLLDCDLRSPAIGRAMGLRSEYGMIELIRGNVSFEEAAVPYHKNMDLQIVTGGTPTSDTSEALNSREIKDLIADLREKADYVIIDTPPSAVVSDASWMSRYVDGGIFVVKQDYAKVDILQEGMEMHAGTGVKIMGTVLNYTVSGITGSGYGYGNYGYGRSSYGYGSRYGYGYGYGADESEENENSEEAQTAEESAAGDDLL